MSDNSVIFGIQQGNMISLQSRLERTEEALRKIIARARQAEMIIYEGFIKIA